MDYNQEWPAGGASQAFDGMHDGMLPPDPLSQPHDGGQSSTWMSSQGQSYPARFGPPLFIQTHQQSPIHGGGLPSPTPTAAAASPTEWGERTISSVDGSWPTMSPASPAVRQRRGSGFENLDTLFYAPSTTSTTGDTRLHGCWSSDAGFPVNFSHPYSGVPTSSHGVSEDFSTAWSASVGPMSVSSMPPTSERFMEPAYSHAFDGSAAEAQVSAPPNNNKLAPSNTSQHAPKRTKPPTPAPMLSTAAATRPKTATSAKSKPNPKHTPFPSHPRSSTTPKTKPATKTTSSSSSSSNSSKTTRRSTTPTGPSLRTAARRFKRPTPSPKPGESDEHHRARTNHNLVEQQYRHRLHAKFEDLLDALANRLPLEGEEEGEEDDEDGDMEGVAAAVGGKGVVGGAVGKGKGGKNRRMSKVDVLNRASRAIRYLESALEGKQREIELLKQEMEELRRQLQGKR
ncbi:hypothetical protein C8A05DRAFT_13605 [Staphylotrichum tortipilum]|uniref:BHLH domain-containing protein n=1 Tax=Staphylotrichum tortipilum TaxID=2831512 RepID=A0AAN6MP69_9PEZI|nr:hypothetical protein C8A05DRAFT_13605 [Staphylotrichum longicolle]